MTISVEQIQSVTGHGNVVTDAGDKVGDIGQIYLNDQSGEPAWVTVKTGLFGTAENFVPLEGARVDGDNVVVAFDKDTIKDAPRIESDGSISPRQEQSLYRHYGLSSPDGGGRNDLEQRDPDRNDTDRNDTDRNDSNRTGVNTETTGGAPRRDVADDDAMTRSEERLRVGTETQVAGRAVLRKYVVTEYVTQTVPVRREELRLEHEPITDANRGTIADHGVAAAFGEDEDVFEVVLHKEVPVVQTETVPVERVRLRKAVVTDQATVSDNVRKEQVAVDDPTQQSREGLPGDDRTRQSREGLTTDNR